MEFVVYYKEERNRNRGDFDMPYEEMIMKARHAKSAQDLIALAQEIGVEMTEESANAYFEQLHQNGELSDDELDSVSGGGCETSSGHTIVTSELKCFTGQYLPNYYYVDYGYTKQSYTARTDNEGLRKLWYNNCSGENRCGNCRHLEFTGGTGYCGKS